VKRRTWIKAVGAAIGNRFLIASRASAADAIQPRAFQLLDPAFVASVAASLPPQRIHIAPVGIQDAQVYRDNIYYLAKPRLSMVCEIGCVAFDGTAVWRHRLPPGIYVALGVRDDGSPVVQRLGALNGRPANSLYSVDVNATPLALGWIGAPGEGPRAYFLNSTQFGRIVNQNALELNTLTRLAAGEPPTSYPLPRAVTDRFDILERSTRSVVVADFTNGDLIEVNPANSSAVSHPITEPEIASALTRLQGFAAQHNVSYQLVAACGATGAGKISLVTFPFKGGVAPLIQYDSSFNVSRVISVFLSPIPLAVPSKIFRIGTEIGVMFSDGSINAFTL
jgi:hypothetical protein